MDLYNVAQANIQGNQLLNQGYTTNEMRGQKHDADVQQYNKRIQGDKTRENIDDLHHGVSEGIALPSKLYQMTPGTNPFKQAVALQRDFNAQTAAKKALSSPDNFIQTSIEGKQVQIPTKKGVSNLLQKTATSGTPAEQRAAKGITADSSPEEVSKAFSPEDVLKPATGADPRFTSVGKTPGGFTEGMKGEPATLAGGGSGPTKVTPIDAPTAQDMGPKETQVRQSAALQNTTPTDDDLQGAKEADITEARGGLAQGAQDVSDLRATKTSGILDTVLQGPEGIAKAVAQKAGAGEMATRVAGKVGGNVLGAGLDMFEDIKNVAGGGKFFEGTGKSGLDKAGNVLTLGAGALDAASLAVPILAPFAALTDLVAGGVSTAGAVMDEIHKKQTDVANKVSNPTLVHPEQMTQMGLIANQGHNPTMAIRGQSAS
jgi:hypothetical protein